MTNPDNTAADGSLAATTITTGGTSTTAMTTTTTTTTAPKTNGGSMATKPKQRHHHHHHHRNSWKSSPTSRAHFNDDEDDEDDDDDENLLLHHQYNSSTTSSTFLPSPALAISGGSSTENDNAYITEIARRSVARAALHLGIEGMEGMALDTLGSVLLGYLEMVGTTISTNVEISGRSSAHVNAYDALNAVSECTAPAAMQLGVGGGPGVDTPDLSLISISDRSQRTPPLPQEDQHQQRGWEGLASFLFGQEWFSIHLGGEEDFNEKEEDVDADAKMNGSQTMTGATPGGDEDGKKVVSANGNSDASSSAPPKKAISGGKTFLPNRPTLPSSSDENGDLTSTQPKAGKGKQLLTKMMKSDKTVTFSLDGQKSSGEDGKIIDLVASDENDGFSSSDDAAVGRWHAPYLHTVPAFPVVKNSKAIANPHRLAEKKITLSLHDYSTEMEACVDYSPKKRTKKGSVVVVDNRETKQNAVGLRDEMAERAMRAALRIPDDVYFTMGTVWGSVRMEDGSSKVKLQTTTPSADATSTSKEKLNSSPKPMLSSSNKNGVEEHDSSATVSMPPYVPNFLPPFPSDYSSGIKKHDSMITASMTAASSVMGNILSRLHNRDKKRKSSSDNSLAVGEIVKPSVLSNRNALRRSVIDLGRSVGHSYWGSNTMDVDTIDDVRRCSTSEQSTNTNDIFSNTLSDMSVERGRASSSSAMEATAASKKTDGLVAPLTRASGSRFTKILEGSMGLS